MDMTLDKEKILDEIKLQYTWIAENIGNIDYGYYQTLNGLLGSYSLIREEIDGKAYPRCWGKCGECGELIVDCKNCIYEEVFGNKCYSIGSDYYLLAKSLRYNDYESAKKYALKIANMRDLIEKMD